MWVMKLLALAAILGTLLLIVLANLFTGFDVHAMSLNGWIALALGAFFSLLIGGGLMVLVFYSARKGYDDRIQVDTPDEDR